MRKNAYAFIASIVSMFVPLVVFATTIDQTIRLILPTDSSEYNLNGGSSFNTLTIDSTKFTFEIGPGGSVELISQDKKNLSNDGSYSIICNSGDSRLVMSVPSGGATKTVVITPSGTCSSASPSGGGSPSIGSTSGGGGGGGGGGSTPPTTPPSPAPVPVSTSTIATSTTSITSTPSVATLSPSPAPVSAKVAVSVVFEKDLAYGMKNTDVSKLQALLASDKSLYPEGIVNGIFGPSTLRAVKRFQAKYGLPQIGRVGPQTRAKLAEVFGGASAPVPAPTTILAPSPFTPSSSSALFTKDMAYGLKENEDVLRLQTLLATDKSTYPEGVINGYFGPATLRAVKRFQAKYGLSQVGRVGPQTRAKLAEVFGGAEAPPPPATTPSPTTTNVEDATIKQLQDQLKALQEQLKAIQK